MILRRPLPLLPALAGLVLAGCLVGPDYERPELTLPETYMGAETTDTSLGDLPWWQVFNDPAMVALLNAAVDANRDLRVAAARVAEAQARYGVARSAQFPVLGVEANAARGNSGELLRPGSGPTNSYFAGLGAAYEADLWGQFRRGSEAARAELLASAENRRVVLITLLADVASAYLLLQDLDARLQISVETERLRHESTELIRARFAQGTVALIDVNQAEVQEAEAAAQVAALSRQVRETENLLNLLVGRNPQPILRDASLQTSLAEAEQRLAPAIPVGLPSQLLERRPDIRRAERALAAQTARIGIAQSLRFPAIRLTGSFGVASDELSGLSSGTTIWGVGIDLFAPLIDAGRRRAQVAAEVARTEAAVNVYEQTVLAALREVEDALAGIQGYRRELAARTRQVRAARSASNLSRARYDGGVTDYLEVLDSERSLFNAQLAASQVRRLELVSLVQLYRALGGGWTPDDIDRAPPEPAVP
ncbi:MAG: efflux transporter outer membrane subunit [Gammaproteobacteria bacterium]|nr:efflux transporter outer membrane subunit [Gammaproteobacteria bacterium]